MGLWQSSGHSIQTWRVVPLSTCPIKINDWIHDNPWTGNPYQPTSRYDTGFWTLQGMGGMDGWPNSWAWCPLSRLLLAVLGSVSRPIPNSHIKKVIFSKCLDSWPIPYGLWCVWSLPLGGGINVLPKKRHHPKHEIWEISQYSDIVIKDCNSKFKFGKTVKTCQNHLQFGDFASCGKGSSNSTFFRSLGRCLSRLNTEMVGQNPIGTLKLLVNECLFPPDKNKFK